MSDPIPVSDGLPGMRRELETQPTNHKYDEVVATCAKLVKSVRDLADHAARLEEELAQYRKEKELQVQAESYRAGEWPHVYNTDQLRALFYARLPAIREAAEIHGYAIGLHGSMVRDMDLIAVAWVDGASDRDTLAHAIARAATGITRDGAYQWNEKPLGRCATSIPCAWPEYGHGTPGLGHIDLSVAPVWQQRPSETTLRVEYDLGLKPDETSLQAFLRGADIAGQRTGFAMPAHKLAKERYLRDAKTMDEPWLLWQYRLPCGEWMQCVSVPEWSPKTQYRRNPQT